MASINFTSPAGQTGAVLLFLWLMRFRTEKLLIFLLFFLTGCSPAESQSIRGSLPLHAGEEIRLEAFNGFEPYLISSGRVSAQGHFTLSYSNEHIGMGRLTIADEQFFVVVLSGEDIELRGQSLALPETIELLSGQQNLLFEQYASEHPRREQALSAWTYLSQIYQADSLFAVQPVPREAISQEMERIRQEDNDFIESLPADSYIHWYLPVRRLVSSVPVVAQFRTGEIPQTIRAFRELDHTDARLYKSGLLADVLESHVWLIENSGRSLDSVFVELNHSIDILTGQLAPEPGLFNEIMEYLFDLLEQRSLFTSSEYLALSLLENHPDLLTSRLASKLELYRAMKVGGTAPDILFNENTLFPDGVDAGSLSEIDAQYILVVFAAGWCPYCRQMKPELLEHYPAWREADVEVLLVSLDENPEDFEQFAGDLPFIRTSDYQRWNSPMVRDYQVHSIPAMVLLDQNLEIVLHPNSVGHTTAWVDWYLVKGNQF